jgi:hypothetical protein
MAAKEPSLLTWGFPLAGLAGTVAGTLIAFARIGTEPQWKTVLRTWLQPCRGNSRSDRFDTGSESSLTCRRDPAGTRT